MDQRMKIILSPLDGGHTPDSVPIRADCGCQCWIAPTGLQMVLSPIIRTQTVCMRHVDPKELAQQIREHGGLRSLPGGREELRAALGQEEADDIYRQFKVEEWDGRTEP